ncbi:MAG TPA: hypothetical protein VGM62_18570 [Chthoniobacterales bacterium]
MVVWFGIALDKKIDDWFPRIAGGALIFFGLYYIWRQLAGKAHTHPFVSDHVHGKQVHAHEHE